MKRGRSRENLVDVGEPFSLYLRFVAGEDLPLKCREMETVTLYQKCTRIMW